MHKIHTLKKNLKNSGLILKQLTIAKRRISGRNHKGHLVLRHRGGGHKRRYRLIDFFKNKAWGIPAQVLRLSYDPNRTAYINLIAHANGMLSYTIATHGIKKNDKIQTQNNSYNWHGYTKQLSHMPTGNFIHNLELRPGSGSKLMRAAGCSAQILRQIKEYSLVRLRSGELRLLLSFGIATLGVVSNINHKLNYLHKAGQVRWRGRRPKVRGVAMNPIDHPHGGGEGRTSGGRPSVSYKARLTKNVPTRSTNKTNRFIYRSRRFLKLKNTQK